jgi:hypothetical protein
MVGPGWMKAAKAGRNTDLEWFVSALLAATGLSVFGHFGEKTPLWRRLSKWAFYFGVTALLARGPGRPWTFVWIAGLPGVGLMVRLWWCRKHGIDPLTAEPKDRYYELRVWSSP